MIVEEAGPEDLAAVMNVFDGADLEVSAETVDAHIDRSEVLVARSKRGTVLAALVGRPRERDVRIEPIAVRPGRRGQGIGTVLIREAGTRWGRLTASFDRELAPFYRQAGFEVDYGDRCSGRLDPNG
ncbi:MAG: GNAT family N-acetyltransferase [Halodesulfurarchaeum sp.]|nr:GNAT family N-acetyltransferase [Halodesulfurarchaeum sp.]